MFMQPEILETRFAIATDTYGESCCVPAEFYEDCEFGPAEDADWQEGYAFRLSAPGYMDCTAWYGATDKEELAEGLADLLDMGDGTTEDGEDVEEFVKKVLKDYGIE